MRFAILRALVSHPLPRWALAVTWTALACLLMLLPGEDSVAEDTSGFFGGTDLTDAAGHVLLFGGLTLFWYVALVCHSAPAEALRLALGLAGGLGVLLEAGQSLVPERGVSLLDFSANALGVCAAAYFLYAASGRRSLSPR